MPVDPAAARRQAHVVLSPRRFAEPHPPRPLRGVLRWIGDRVHAVLRPFGEALGSLVAHPWVGLPVAVLLLVAVIAIASRLVSRVNRGRVDQAGWVVAEGNRSDDPTALERAADQAEGDGRFEDALRLRFRAGLARLAIAGRLPAGAVEPNGEIARTLGSHRFDGLSRTFDEVVYGRRPPRVGDAVAAKRDWPEVLEEAGR